jgi:hypothetical protein
MRREECETDRNSTSLTRFFEWVNPDVSLKSPAKVLRAVLATGHVAGVVARGVRQDVAAVGVRVVATPFAVLGTVLARVDVGRLGNRSGQSYHHNRCYWVGWTGG